MKLYATVSSERASKGQGGNKYLTVEVRTEHKELLMQLCFGGDLKTPRIHYNSNLIGIGYNDFQLIPWDWETKGERQKGECVHSECELNGTCKVCGRNATIDVT